MRTHTTFWYFLKIGRKCRVFFAWQIGKTLYMMFYYNKENKAFFLLKFALVKNPSLALMNAMLTFDSCWKVSQIMSCLTDLILFFFNESKGTFSLFSHVNTGCGLKILKCN